MERLTDPKINQEEEVLDTSLRPRSLSEFVGQEKIKANLSILIDAAKKRKEPIEHVLLYGNPGLGKTTLAHLIAAETGANIKVTSGPAMEKVGDIAAILSSLETGDILFVDEIHRMNRTIEEVLYPALEDFSLDIILGKGPSARTVRLALNRFTLIGATTKLSLLSSPLRDRFGATYNFSFYEPKEIEAIVSRSARILAVNISPDGIAEIASRARRTPRVANRLLKRVRDYSQVKGMEPDGQVAKEALALLDVDEYGLDATDRQILNVIVNKFSGGPVGLGTLAAATSEEVSTIEEIYEPFLIQMGFLSRTPRGRMATELAYKHLGLNPPATKQTPLV
ncbi:Holliday junction branch migration DNA helicase RuvB [Candidatus Uhrbacteria bacterium]|nr:Holliday junction branch migration DNA helicase RuvB [Candidatus Uhrbacteria bacterium]